MRTEILSWTAVPDAVRILFGAQKIPEGSWAWFDTLAQTTLTNDETPIVATLIDAQGKVVAAIPLVRDENHFVRGLTSPYTTLFRPPLGESSHAQIFGQHLAGTIRGQIRLDCLDLEDPAVTAFARGLVRGGLLSARYRHFANWFEHISDFSSYWSGRNSQLKSTIKRKLSALSRDDRLEFELVDLSACQKRSTDIYQAVYAKSWKPPEPHVDFIGTLIKRLGAYGLARLGIVRVAGEPAAVQIWLVQAPKATIFKLAHDPKFEWSSPGTLLTHWMLKKLYEDEGVHDVDFGRGDDAYKKNWLHLQRFRYGIIAANPRTLSGLASVLLDVAPTYLSALLRNRRIEARNAQ